MKLGERMKLGEKRRRRSRAPEAPIPALDYSWSPGKRPARRPGPLLIFFKKSFLALELRRQGDLLGSEMGDQGRLCFSLQNSGSKDPSVQPFISVRKFRVLSL
jgi:hypothetical protein